MTIKAIYQGAVDAVSSVAKSGFNTVSWGARSISNGFNNQVVSRVSTGTSYAWQGLKNLPQATRSFAATPAGKVIIVLALLAGVAALAVKYFKKDAAPLVSEEKLKGAVDEAKKALDAEKAKPEPADLNESTALKANITRREKDLAAAQKAYADSKKNWFRRKIGL